MYLFNYVLGMLSYMQSYWPFVNKLYAILLAFCEWENLDLKGEKGSVTK